VGKIWTVNVPFLEAATQRSEEGYWINGEWETKEDLRQM
jgi:hypothetical protein